MPIPTRLLALSLVAVVAAACTGAGAASSEPVSAEPSESPAATGIAYPTGADDLVLRLRYVGGFAPASSHLVDLPAVSVYGDGTVIVPGPVLAIYPGPALPNLQRATITPAGMQILLEAARDAGLLGRDVHYDLEGIMDASSAEFTLNAEGGVHTVSAYALMEGTETPQGPDAAVTEARSRLATLQTQLGNLDALLGGELGPWSAYQAESVQLLVGPGAPDDGQGLTQQPVAWPLSTPLATFGEALPDLLAGQRCGVVSGDDVDALMPLLEAANSLSPWTDGDASYGIIVRPLLPAEEGCPTAAE
jgi:hypothetical protein